MNWDQVEGKWKQLKGQLKEKWGKLTDDDLDVIDGRRPELVGKIQERYGLARVEAERQADEFIKSMKTLPDETNTFEAERARRVGRG
jgi:uncharacterized protein YjbJ (UPF0337 family)